MCIYTYMCIYIYIYIYIHVCVCVIRASLIAHCPPGRKLAAVPAGGELRPWDGMCEFVVYFI